MDYTVHGILQARILEWVAYHFSRGSSQPRDRTQVSCIVGSLPAEPQGKPKNTGVGSLSLLHQIFLTQDLNQDLLDCRWILYQLSYEGSPVKIQTPSIGVLKCERHCPIALQKLSWLVFITIYSEVDFPGGSDCKESTCNAGDLGWEVPLEKGWLPTPVFLPGEPPWTEEPGGLQSMGSQRVGHDWSDWASMQNCF